VVEERTMPSGLAPIRSSVDRIGALHDDLTGLPGSRLLLDRLNQAIVRSRRTRASVAVLSISLDRFTLVNDTLGHVAGDQLLIGVADRLRECLRETDTCARVGGDEFVVVCEDIARHTDGAIVARRLAAGLAAGMSLADRSVAVHASIGLALSAAGSSPRQLLDEADAAMRRAKHEGRSWELAHIQGNRWAIANRTGQDAVAVRLAAAGSLLVFGVRNWTNTVERWPDGVSVEVLAQTAWRRNDPPELRIVWSADGTSDRDHALSLPWPRSN
jgi:diguanylate cyclase (GGDEF)-like protein